MLRLAIWLLSFTYAIQDRCIKKPQFYYAIDWETPGSVYTRSLPRIIVAHYHAVSARISRSLYPSYPKPSKPYGISAPLRFYRIGGIFH